MKDTAEQTSLENEAGPSATRNRLFEILGAVASILILVLALGFLYRVFAELSLAAVVSHIKSVPVLALTISIALAVCHYSVSTTHDAVALGYLRSVVSYRSSALTSFIARAVGQNIGVATLSGSSIRERIYSQLGLSASEITRLILFVSATGVLGGSAMTGFALLAMPPGVEASPGWLRAIIAPVGEVLLALPVIYLATVFVRRAPVNIAGWELTVPSPRIALAQLGMACVGLLFATATMYVLLAAVSDIGFASFVPVYLLARAAGLISRIPGGLGVFEAVLFLLLPTVPPDALLGSIIVYRCIAYVVPLVIASIIVIQRSGRQPGRPGKETAPNASDGLSFVVPQLIGTLVFLTGLVLLVAAASPPPGELHRWLIASGLPLPVIEVSHLLGGAVGAALLLLARGLFRRLHVAYLGTVAALLTGLIVSFPNGPVYVDTIVIGAIAIALYLSRRQFYRQGSLVRERFPARWTSSIVFGIGLALWTGLISYQHIDYSNGLWLEFAVDSAAPRSLRAFAAASITAIAYLVWALVSKAHTTPLPATLARDSRVVLPVLQDSPRPAANLALLGDKRLLWSEDERAFLMYQVSGDSWVACGDPLGPPSHQEGLVRAFCDTVKRNHGRPLFYLVGEEQLSLYIDLGLTLTKVAEEARLNLSGFSLQDGRHSALRESVEQIKQHGFEFEIVPKAGLTPILADLRRVSTSWIADKYATEKRFSLGSFSEEYIANFDCAVVKVDGTVAAFASIWRAPAGKELAIDLLRYTQLAPKSIMDYLFVELMAWARANGYSWFNLGMAPLAVTEQRPLAPLRDKLDKVVCGHSDNFYDLEGLRRFKDKFNPAWRPRYLASPPGWRQLPNALLDTSRMISGGVAGMFARP